jgi:hypothetical protein
MIKLALALPAFLAMALPCAAQDFRAAEPSVLYFVSIPLGGVSRTEGRPAFGIALQEGGRERRVFRVHTGMMNLAGADAIELRWLIFGGVVAAAALAGAAGKSQSRAPQSPAPCSKQAAC